jgi:hypothetical protein
MRVVRFTRDHNGESTYLQAETITAIRPLDSNRALTFVVTVSEVDVIREDLPTAIAIWLGPGAVVG